MIEMRWLNKVIAYYQDGLPTGPIRREKVLQYRYNDKFQREGGDWGDSWSDWIDVPTVEETK